MFTQHETFHPKESAEADMNELEFPSTAAVETSAAVKQTSECLNVDLLRLSELLFSDSNIIKHVNIKSLSSSNLVKQ